MRQFVFYIELMLLGKAWIQRFFLQLRVNNRADFKPDVDLLCMCEREREEWERESATLLKMTKNEIKLMNMRNILFFTAKYSSF